MDSWRSVVSEVLVVNLGNYDYIVCRVFWFLCSGVYSVLLISVFLKIIGFVGLFGLGELLCGFMLMVSVGIWCNGCVIVSCIVCWCLIILSD